MQALSGGEDLIATCAAVSLAGTGALPIGAETGALHVQFKPLHGAADMPLLLDHSVHTGLYRIARQPRCYRGKHAPAWTKIEIAFSVPVPGLNYWVLIDALGERGQNKDDVDPHAFLRYCIRQGWLERV